MTRRQVLAGFAAVGLTAVTGCASKQKADTPTAAADESVDPAFVDLEKRFDGVLGLTAIDLRTGSTIRHRASTRFAMCSTFKVYAVAAVLGRSDRGELDLATSIPVAPVDVVANSPVTADRAGTDMTLADLCAAALINSDNTAGNLLLREIGGPSAITEFARTVGDAVTRLDRWETDLNTAIPGDERDTTTAEALTTGFLKVLTGDVLSVASRDRLENWMRSNVTSAKRIRAGLPAEWTSADKTGGGDYGATNDAGLLTGPAGQRVMITILTRTATNRRESDPLNDLIAATTAAALDRLGH
ncbi:class A beta-lactamase [Antrihabitans stalactiti]|uniref:Beta-lactamase n=1 Tax=Antrihabitans stalactiti TaxID=2584121 RepID=A0A848KAX1_9NOCA|nr:class A beta-lactamase [Antrihabitans stalactiti]NMN94628.1 class A beta-lactamase [Antrihabitans stalactiti]